jgi:hypothetical protein
MLGVVGGFEPIAVGAEPPMQREGVELSRDPQVPPAGVLGQHCGRQRRSVDRGHGTQAVIWD